MSSIPANFARTPNLLFSQLSLSRLNRTGVEMFRTQEQLSTGHAINRLSDDAIKAATILTLDDRIERSEQVRRNLSHASASLGVLDDALGEAYDLALQAREIAVQQMNFSSSRDERNSQAVVIDQILQSLYGLGNRESVAGYLFGGDQPGAAPLSPLGSGYRYTGRGEGLRTDLALVSSVPIAVGATALAGLSSRVQGTVDLDPRLTLDQRLTELDGGRGLGIALGTIEFSFAGGPTASVDLAGADSVRDVSARLTAALRSYETAQGVTILGPGGVGVLGESLAIDIAPGAGASLRFFDVGTGVTALDLGLRDTGGTIEFTPASAAGASVRPRLTERTALSSLAGVTLPLGSLRITNAGRSAVVDLYGATTLEQVKNIIEGSGLGVRVRLNAAGNGIDVLSEVSAGREQALSIGEVAGGDTATRLGIRTFGLDTAISAFNDGRGVRVIDGVADPITGLPRPDLNVDFEIVLGNAGQTRLSIDLRPQDMVSVQTVLARINAEAATGLAAAGLAPGDFSAGLAGDGNGIVFRQSAGFASAMRVEARNNSTAAEQLGLINGVYDPGSATLLGSDRAKTRPNTVISHLIDLRDALRGNDTNGIRLAAEGLEGVIGSLAETRGLVGSYAKRVDFAAEREEDKNVLDARLRSELKDTDFAAAASRYTLLQTQLEAGLRTTATAGSTTLLDFLG